MKQEVVQTKYYITIILYQELYTYVVPVNVDCSYQVYFSGFHCGKLINNFIKITLFHFALFNQLIFVQFLVQRSIPLRLFDSLVSSRENQLFIVF